MKRSAVSAPLLALAHAVALASPLGAQDAAGHVKAGVAAYEAVKTQEALDHFKAAVAADSTSYEANWRVARAALDLAMFDTTKADSFLPLAERHARKAVALDSTRAEGHAMVAVTASGGALVAQERKRMSPDKLFRVYRTIVKEAKTAITLDPKLDTPHRVLGVWYGNMAGIREQNQPNVVDATLGRALAAETTWENAIKHLEEAKALAPNSVSTRLALGQVYAARKRPAEARAELRAADSLPSATINDAKYKERTKAALAALPATP